MSPPNDENRHSRYTDNRTANNSNKSTNSTSTTPSTPTAFQPNHNDLAKELGLTTGSSTTNYSNINTSTTHQENDTKNNGNSNSHPQSHNDSSIDSSKVNSPLLSSLPSLTALTSAISIPGQTSTINFFDFPKTNGSSNTTNSMNPSSTTNSSNNNNFALEDDQTYSKMNLIIVCVGLPARGKSYITKKLQKYLNWMQYETKIFNVGNVRRQEHVKPSDYPVQGPTGASSTSATPTPTPTPTPGPPVDSNDGTSHDANFFDHSNPESFHKREQWAIETLNQVIDYLLSGQGNVGIFDATNTTKARRRWIIQTINNRTKGTVKVMFLESICDDQSIIEKNIRLKLSGPDYKDMDPNLALEDFKNRLKNYEKVYETIDDEEEKENEKYDIQYLKIINAGRKIVSYNINGYLASQAVFFLLNFNLSDRQIWLTVNGETEDSLLNIKGGDSSLTKKGDRFARALPKFIGKKRQEFKLRKLNQEYINDLFFSHHTEDQNKELANAKNINVAAEGITTTASAPSSAVKLEGGFNIWTSTLQRSIQTASYFPSDTYELKTFRMLNDLGCGSIDGMSDAEFRSKHPNEYINQLKNRLSFRFPGIGGESYLDVISRLRPMIIELERLKDHVLIVSHRVITRVLLGYFMNLSKEMLTELDVQHGFVYCIEPKPYGLHLKIYNYDEFTDDFYEVDEIEFMKKKRHRGSMSISTNVKGRVVLTEKPSDSAIASSSSEEEEEEEENDFSSDDDDASNSSTYVPAPFERTVSQSFEFKNDSGSSTPIRGAEKELDFNFNLLSSPLGQRNSNANALRTRDRNGSSFEDLNFHFSRPGGSSRSHRKTPSIGQQKPHAHTHAHNHMNETKQQKGTIPSSASTLEVDEFGNDIDATVAKILSNKKLLKRLLQAISIEE